MRIPLSHWLAIPALCMAVSSVTSATADDALKADARKALLKAVAFYSEKVSSHGGYLYRYSADLKKQEGEGPADRDTVWVQPPGTPAVGMALVTAYQRTQEPALLKAAEAAGDCLVRGQLRSGGWSDQIDFAADKRTKTSYRVDPLRPKASNISTLDDDKTQSALRFMTRLDETLQFKDARIHEASLFAFDGVLKAQFPNGGWGQRFDEYPDPAKYPVLKASYPEQWPRTYPGAKYWMFYTFNDNSISDTIDALLLAAHVYNEPRYRDAAIKAGEFILLAQMPEPQPAWAQQYNFEMQPVWARKFEPPAVSGSESQRLIEALMVLYTETGDRKFLEPIPRAIAYLNRSEIAAGQLARFYELKTNKPLYFTTKYELTHDDSDLPTHYGFKVGSKLKSISERYETLAKLSPEKLAAKREAQFKTSRGAPRDADVQAIIAAMDERGAWVEDGRLSYHGKDDDTRRVIKSETFIKNIDLLSRYIAAK